MKTTLQALCVVLIAVGIVVEASYQAHMGFICISAGSLAFGIATKIDRRKKKDPDE